MSSKHEVSNPVLELQQQPKQALTQRLIMSAHMQQAIHLLQIPLLEIEPFIEEQITQNPVLEVIDEFTKSKDLNEDGTEAPSSDMLEKEVDTAINDHDFSVLKQLDEEFDHYFNESEQFQPKRSTDEEKYKTYLESSILAEVNLYNKLIQEAAESFNDPTDIEMAKILIGYFDESGFLTTPLQEIATLQNFDENRLKFVLNEIQTFEPYGVGASSVQESLLIQMRCLGKTHTLAYTILKDYYEELLHNRIPLIQKSLKCSYEEIQSAIEKDIALLDLHPGTQFSIQKVQQIVPDVSLRYDEDELVVDVNRDCVPNLRLNRKYLRMLEDSNVALETKNFIRRHIFSAKWLMRNLQQRYSTIERIAASLAKRQHDFFTKVDGQLVPLTMKVLAEELNVHESTIARTVSNKYINTPKGLMPLRAFFTTEYISDTGESLSSKTIRDTILEMIEKEDKHVPLSDEKISVLLKEKGIVCARRTVAKYRANLGIGNTLQRKKFKK